MEKILLSLSPDQIHEIKQLIQFRKDFTAECPLCQEMLDFLDYLHLCLDNAENEFLANGYCLEEGDIYAEG